MNLTRAQIAVRGGCEAIEFVLGEMRDVQRPQQFDAVVMAFSFFKYFEDISDDLKRHATSGHV